MKEIWILLAICCVMWHFYHQRKISEAARYHMKKYCDQNGLQYISIAKIKARLTVGKRGLVWKNLYDFEFSGDGESLYKGTVTLYGTRLDNVELPPYRVN